MDEFIADINYWAYQLHLNRQEAAKLCDKFWEGKIGFDLEDQLIIRSLLMDMRINSELLEDQLVALQKEVTQKKPFWKKLFRK